MAECCTSVYDRGSYYVGRSFERIAARGTRGPRHMSVGRFRPQEVDTFKTNRAKGQRTMTPDTPCYLPWTFLECEAGDLLDNMDATRSLLEEMRAEGFDTSRMHLRYSGNQSFWICVPAEMMGHPLGSVSDQKALRQRVFGPLTRCPLDTGLFDARHLHRLLGSIHERGRRTQIMPYKTLYSRSAFEDHLSDTPTPPPISFGGPDAPLFARTKAKTKFHVPPMDDVSRSLEGSGLMQKTKDGVGKGRRNDVAFRRACVLWRRYDREGAWDHLTDWNQRNDPPLPTRELRSCFRSARRIATR